MLDVTKNRPKKEFVAVGAALVTTTGVLAVAFLALTDYAACVFKQDSPIVLLALALQESTVECNHESPKIDQINILIAVEVECVEAVLDTHLRKSRLR